MGLIASRLNLENFNIGRRPSQEDATSFFNSINKNYFSNYFIMGGQRFEVSDPDYLFGDKFDLRVLSHTKLAAIPYKRAQRNLLSNLNVKYKSNNKVSSQGDRLNSSISILTRQSNSDDNKLNIQNHTTDSSKGPGNRISEPSKPLVMPVNIRKETLRLIKCPASNESDKQKNIKKNSNSNPDQSNSNNLLMKKCSFSKEHRPPHLQQQLQHSHNRYSATSSRATTATIVSNEASNTVDQEIGAERISQPCSKIIESDIGSLLSASSSIKSGYISMKGDNKKTNLCDESSDDDYEDALNDANNLSDFENDDEDPEETQQQRSLLSESRIPAGVSTSVTFAESEQNCDIKINIDSTNGCMTTSFDEVEVIDEGQTSRVIHNDHDESYVVSIPSSSGDRESIPRTMYKLPPQEVIDDKIGDGHPSAPKKAYNIEFIFDSDTDCCIRIYYLSNCEATSRCVRYYSQYSISKSKFYSYKKGLNQKFSQPKHVFEPSMFQENCTGRLKVPVVIHIIARKESQTLISLIEKNSSDEGYSIKPIKQLILVDGVQYILQDIYGLENMQLFPSQKKHSSKKKRRITHTGDNDKKAKTAQSCRSNQSVDGTWSSSDTVSVISAQISLSSRHERRDSITSQQFVTTDDTSLECVVCISEERDTMLLPCRHLCLCSSCAQSLRNQANCCPICRRKFRAALNIRVINQSTSNAAISSTSNSATAIAETEKSMGNTSKDISGTGPQLT